MSEDDDTLPDMATRPSRRPRLKFGRRDRDATTGEPAAALGADGDGGAAPTKAGHAPPYADSRLEDLVVITGYSGAGKSTAMAVFEDAGYFCVDNLPPEMIRALVELFVHEGSKVEHAAVVSDIRGGDYFEAFQAVLDDLAALGLRHRVLFLDADEQTLLTRYKETRRRHPAAPGSSVTQGVAAERAVLEAVKDRADVVIDSTGLKAHMLRRKIADEFLPRVPATRLAVTLESFGFKHGPARDADLVLDVRFLPNPHYEPALRPLTGHDARVVAYIERDGRLGEFYARVIPLLDFLLPQYVSEGKAHLTIAIGCTGGRHRSVAIAEHLGQRYAQREDVLVEVVHRDADRASGYGDADPSGTTVEFAAVPPAGGEGGEAGAGASDAAGEDGSEPAPGGADRARSDGAPGGADRARSDGAPGGADRARSDGAPGGADRPTG
jgi:RNase adapter protein RapZ